MHSRTSAKTAGLLKGAGVLEELAGLLGRLRLDLESPEPADPLGGEAEVPHDGYSGLHQVADDVGVAPARPRFLDGVGAGADWRRAAHSRAWVSPFLATRKGMSATTNLPPEPFTTARVWSLHDLGGGAERVPSPHGPPSWRCRRPGGSRPGRRPRGARTRYRRPSP